MNKIQSYEQCNLMIKNFRKAKGKLITNFFFLPKELKAMIERKEILYQQNEGALIFFVEEMDFFHIFYFSYEEQALEIEKPDKTMILDLVAREGQNPKEIKLEEKRWNAVGFREYKSYVRMKYDIDKKSYASKGTEIRKDCDFSCAQQEDIEIVSGLWKTNLNPYSTPLPSASDMKWIIESGHVYVVKQCGIIVGAVFMNAASKSCVLQHLVIDSWCRRQGLGTVLMDYALEGMAQEGIKQCYLWVDIQNIPAYENYKKYGFEKDGLYSKQLKSDGE